MIAGMSSRNRPYSAPKAPYWWMRQLPDRIFHRRRHREARDRLVRLFPVRSILVVCHGNICRSPYMEAVLQRDLPGVSVMSAGLVGPDRPVPKNSLSLTASRGLDLSAFRSRPISRVNAREIDLVIVMDSTQASHLARVCGVSQARIVVAGDLDPLAPTTRAIQDPWGEPLEVFRAAFDRLDRCAATIVALIRSPHETSSEIVSSRRLETAAQ